MFFFGEFFLERDEELDVGGVFGNGDRETFSRELVVAGASALGETGEEGFFIGGEVENPRVGGVQIFGLFEPQRGEIGGVEGGDGLEADEKTIVLASEGCKGV